MWVMITTAQSEIDQMTILWGQKVGDGVFVDFKKRVKIPLADLVVLPETTLHKLLADDRTHRLDGKTPFAKFLVDTPEFNDLLDEAYLSGLEFSEAMDELVGGFWKNSVYLKFIENRK
jgi:hypothetical protein